MSKYKGLNVANTPIADTYAHTTHRFIQTPPQCTVEPFAGCVLPPPWPTSAGSFGSSWIYAIIMARLNLVGN